MSLTFIQRVLKREGFFGIVYLHSEVWATYHMYCSEDEKAKLGERNFTVPTMALDYITLMLLFCETVILWNRNDHFEVSFKERFMNGNTMETI